jgi:hypothetical protein
MFLCVSMTPFGVPVDPEVYMTQNTSSGLAGMASFGFSVPSRSTSSMWTTFKPSRFPRSSARTDSDASPSYTTSRTDGQDSITFVSVGRSSALVNMLRTSGSCREWERPCGPRESYAVQMVTAENAQAWAMTCQLTLEDER